MISGNLGKCFDASREPDKVALIEPGDFLHPRLTTYAELDAECDAVARGLLARGYRAGDAIGLLAENSRELLAAYFGIMRAGMVAVPFSFRASDEVRAHIARDAGLKAVFHDQDRAARVPPGPARIALDGPGYAGLLDPGSFDTVEPAPRGLAMILYTSGSTGMPKGVLLSHASQRWSLETGQRVYGERDDHRYIVAAPMFHMNATISVKGALASHASVVLLPAFRAIDYARAIDAFGVTWLTSVPTMLALLAREAEALGGLDFSTVQAVTMGSAPLTQALIDKVQALFPTATTVINSYGTTEGGPSPFGPHPGGVPRPALSVGYPFDGLEADLREGAGPDEGVLFLRSPMAMEGYHNLPGKTAAVLQDGWYRTGDIMRRDANGFFYFLGRADDMFSVGGENVWPGEVEKLLETHPDVHQACVVPAPHETKHLAPFAFVVPRPGAAPTEAAIKAHALACGPAYMHPRHVRFIEAIPLAGTNKPDRRRLTEEAARIVTQGDAAEPG